MSSEPKDPAGAGPDDPAPERVAAALEELETARRDGGIGTIAQAQASLGVAYARAGRHVDAVGEYDALLTYLAAANQEGSQERDRWTRIMSLASPPPGPDDIDLRLLAAIASIHKAESLILLGRRREATDSLDVAEAGCRGLTKRGIRRHVRFLRQRLEAARQPVQARPEPSPADPSPLEQVAAADELLGEGRHDEAAMVALSAIARGDSVAIRARSRHVLGMALEAAGRGTDALPVLADAFADYLTCGRPAQAAHLAVPLAWRLDEAGKREDALVTMRQAVEAAQESGDDHLRARLLVDLGSMLDGQGAQAQAMSSFDAALALAEDLSETELAANARHGLAVMFANHSGAEPEQAVEALSLLDRCRADYEQAGIPAGAAGCDHEAAALLGRLGSFDAAGARYQRALNGYTKLPDQAAIADEAADCNRNLEALRDSPGSGPDPKKAGLFRSGGHAMRHSDTTERQ